MGPASFNVGLADRIGSTLGVELFSGNDFSNSDEKYRAFDPLYGARHTVNGYMDYFTNIPAHTLGAGLVNPYLKTNFVLSPHTRLDTDIHLFFLQNNFLHQGAVIDKYLGTEIDLTLSYRYNSYATIMFGHSVMFGSESMEVIKGGSKDEFAHWGYVMLRVRPKFL